MKKKDSSLEYKIRKLNSKDINNVVKLIGKALGSYDYRNAKFEIKNIFCKSSYRIYKFVDAFVVELEGRIIGYGGIWALKYDPDSFCMMDWLVIEKAYRRRGAGTTLIQFLLSRAIKRGIKHIYVETSSDNLIALKFYKKYGFKQLCRIPKYYDSGLDLIMLLKNMK